jgi:hypothetical protein
MIRENGRCVQLAETSLPSSLSLTPSNVLAAELSMLRGHVMECGGACNGISGASPFDTY